MPEMTKAADLIQGDDRELIAHAVHNMAGCPAAARRWAQMGLMRSAYDRLTAASPGRLYDMRDAGVLNPAQAGRIVELTELVKIIGESRDDFLCEKWNDTRDFLWTHEFEDDEWRAVARTARQALRLLGRE
jgi:hypothetical protein